MYRTAVRPGEDISQAILRAASEAVRLGLNGYVIVCEKCGQPVRDHEYPSDCATWMKEHEVVQWYA